MRVQELMAEAEAELARVDERMGDGGNAPAPTVHVRSWSHCCFCCHCFALWRNAASAFCQVSAVLLPVYCCTLE